MADRGHRPPGDVLTPERLTDEHRLIARTAADFVRQEVRRSVERSTPRTGAWPACLVRHAGELGLLATDAPESFGGLALDKVSSILVAAESPDPRSRPLRRTTGLAICRSSPFGTQEQQQPLPAGARVEARSSAPTVLSESGSGSDALGARPARRGSPDGGFSLSGEKMWITNAGFADVFIVFAKVGRRAVHGVHRRARLCQHLDRRGRAQDGAARLVDGAGDPAGRAGAGRATSSARSGRGHKVAFNVLNYGRLKLGAATRPGGARAALAEERLPLCRPSAGSSASRTPRRPPWRRR